MTKIITVAGLKGGTAKSTTSIMLSEAIAAAGRKVLLVDTDPQSSVKLWHNTARDNGEPMRAPFAHMVGNDAIEMLATYDGFNRGNGFDVEFVVVDTPAGGQEIEDFLTTQKALEASDFGVLPFIPNDIDIAALPRTLELARSVLKPTAILLSRASLRTKRYAKAVNMINDAGLAAFGTVIRDLTEYTSFQRPSNKTLTEFTSLWNEIVAVLEPQTIDLRDTVHQDTETTNQNAMEVAQ